MSLTELHRATEKLDEFCHALAALMNEVDRAWCYSLACEVSSGLDDKAVSELRRLFVFRKRRVLSREGQRPHAAIKLEVGLERLGEHPRVTGHVSQRRLDRLRSDPQIGQHIPIAHIDPLSQAYSVTLVHKFAGSNFQQLRVMNKRYPSIGIVSDRQSRPDLARAASTSAPPFFNSRAMQRVQSGLTAIALSLVIELFFLIASAEAHIAIER